MTVNTLEYLLICDFEILGVLKLDTSKGSEFQLDITFNQTHQHYQFNTTRPGEFVFYTKVPECVFTTQECSAFYVLTYKKRWYELRIFSNSRKLIAKKINSDCVLIMGGVFCSATPRKYKFELSHFYDDFGVYDCVSRFVPPHYICLHQNKREAFNITSMTKIPCQVWANETVSCGDSELIRIF